MLSPTFMTVLNGRTPPTVYASRGCVHVTLPIPSERVFDRPGRRRRTGTPHVLHHQVDPVRLPDLGVGRLRAPLQEVVAGERVDRVEQTPGRAFLLCGRLEEVRAALERDDSNEERGVFKTVDGGKTWTKALYIDPDTGCSDLDLDPSNPRVVYAAM
jgi:hypothetical protein